MATNGRPVTRINVNYGSLGTTIESRSLNPVIIAPRYAVHSYKDGYEDGYLGTYNYNDFTFAWPELVGSVDSIDRNNVRLIAKKPYVISGKEFSVSKVSNNKITFTGSVEGSVAAGDIAVVTAGSSSIIYNVTEVVGADVWLDGVVSGTSVSCSFASNRQSPAYIEVESGYSVEDAGVYADAKMTTTIAGKTDAEIVRCELYVEFREFVKEGAMSLVSSAVVGAGDWAGVACPDNPLGMMFAVAKSAGGGFFMLALDADTEDAYIRAIDYVAQFETAYSFVPYVVSQRTKDHIISTISKYADPEIAHFKRAWLGATTGQYVDLYTTEAALIEVTGAQNGGTAVTINDSALDLYAARVVPGCMLEINTSVGTQRYEIEDITSSTGLTIKGAPTTASYTGRIVRKRNNTEYAIAVADEARAINNARINLVWGDGVSALGYDNLPLSIACASLASQRASLPPHAPMTDAVVPSITTTDVLKFSDEEYKELNNGGVWVIHNNSDGATVTYHQITTRTDGSIAEEDSCVSAGDAIIRNFRTAIKSFFNGGMNIYPGLIPTVRAQLTAQADAIMSAGYPSIYGPLMLSFTVNELYIPESNKGSIIVNCSAELARPYSGGDFTFNLV